MTPAPIRPVRRPVAPAVGLAAAGLLLLGAAAVTLAAGRDVRRSTAVHRLAERGYTAWEMHALAGRPHLQDGRFTIYYPAGDAVDAGIVARDLDAVAGRVFRDLGVDPPGPLVVRIETRAAMARTFGTSPAEAPLGAYWRGTVWLLAPAAWAGSDVGGRAAAFDSQGPLPHELTHLADDWRSGGRTPPFLDEGIAQWEEWRVNGYVWRAPLDGPSQGYSWGQLRADFNHLPDQALAYQESLAVVRSLAGSGGPAGLARIRGLLSDFARGEGADQAVDATVGPREYQALASGAAWLG